MSELERYEAHFNEDFPRKQSYYMTEEELKKEVDECIEKNLTCYELLAERYGQGICF